MRSKILQEREMLSGQVFLYAQLLGKDFEETITIAQKLAVLKLQNAGRLPEGINIKESLATSN